MKSCYCVQQALHVDVNPCTTLSANYICLKEMLYAVRCLKSNEDMILALAEK